MLLTENWIAFICIKFH